MKQVIDQFMWGFQQQFRRVFEMQTEDALSRIGLPVELRVVLIGFALSDDARHPVCVEPEDGPLSVGHLSDVLDHAVELYLDDPASQILHSDRAAGAQRHLDLSHRCRADAVVEAVEASGVFNGLTFFASESTPVGNYEVHTCVGVPTEVFDLFPALDGPIVDRVYVGRSLQHEVIAECLRRSDRALYFPEPGRELRVVNRPENAVEAAAVTFTNGMVWRAGGIPTDLFQAVNKFTSLSYEQAAARGHLIVADVRNSPESFRVRFQRPVSLHDSRIMRKLLELSDDSTSVITDGQAAYGLGTWEQAPNVAEISVRGHADWELSVNGATLLRVSYGHAKLPRPLIAPSKFADTAQRTLGSIDLERSWPIVEKIRDSGHGTILVITNDPEGEATRLGGQAIPIVPDSLEPADIARFGLVDGAILLDPDGRCYAFGVILDGKASGKGDRARGSRFNSAVRYQKMIQEALLVVISDDGTAELIPDLRPKVHRDKVEDAVRAFCETCQMDPVDGEQFGRTSRQVKKFAFYLDEDQCQRYNQAYENEMRSRIEAGGIGVGLHHLRPHPEMDDSYFY